MRIRTLLAAGGLAMAVVTGSAGIAVAAPAHSGPGTTNGNGNIGAFGNTHTGGVQSPQIGLVQGSFNKPCLALAGKVNVGSLLGAVPLTLQDLNLLSGPQNQQCTDNSAQIRGDGPLSHILSGNPVLSGNGGRFGGLGAR